MEQLREEFCVSILLKIMDINPSGYYKWRKRKDKLNRYEQDRKILTELLKDMHKKHSTYGYHNLAKHIRNETGWVFSDNLAHKCCKEAGIRSTARKTYRHTKGNEHIKFKNIVSGNWNATRPMEILVSDMTEINNKYLGKYEWTFVIDTYNNEIISSHLSRKKGDAKPYIECIKDVVKRTKEQKLPVIFHSDQGSIYSSTSFYEAHKDYTNIIRSMSRVGTPTDNPIIEALNGWIKEELYKDFNLYRTNNVEKLINEYVKYFNNYRLSAKCGWKSPVQFKTEQGYS